MAGYLLTPANCYEKLNGLAWNGDEISGIKNIVIPKMAGKADL